MAKRKLPLPARIKKQLLAKGADAERDAQAIVDVQKGERANLEAILKQQLIRKLASAGCDAHDVVNICKNMAGEQSSPELITELGKDHKNTPGLIEQLHAANAPVGKLGFTIEALVKTPLHNRQNGVADKVDKLEKIRKATLPLKLAELQFHPADICDIVVNIAQSWQHPEQIKSIGAFCERLIKDGHTPEQISTQITGYAKTGIPEGLLAKLNDAAPSPDTAAGQLIKPTIRRTPPASAH